MTDMTADAPASARLRVVRAFTGLRMRRRAKCEGLRLAAGARDLSRPCAVTVAVLAVTLAASILFVTVPRIDLWVSAVFHAPGDGFPAASNAVLRGLRRSSTWVMGGVLLAVLIAAFGPSAWSSGWGRGRRRRGLCMLAAFALGPGLLVNGVLKGVWGRARPINIEAFGGDAPFSAAWAFSEGCFSNCSFTSGEAASAAWTAMAALVLMPRAWRPTAGAAVVAYALALSFNRIAFGGHFLSDVVLSWLLVVLTIILTVRLMRVVPTPERAFVLARPLATA